MFLLNVPLLEEEPTETQAQCLVSINSDATAAITNKKDFRINTVFENFQKPTVPKHKNTHTQGSYWWKDHG